MGTKTYTYEELQAYVSSVLKQHPQSDKLIFCYSRNRTDKSLHVFIVITEKIRIELPWHDGPSFFSPGDYLHASVNDIYGIPAAVFDNCYQKLEGAVCSAVL